MYFRLNIDRLNDVVEENMTRIHEEELKTEQNMALDDSTPHLAKLPRPNWTKPVSRIGQSQFPEIDKVQFGNRTEITAETTATKTSPSAAAPEVHPLEPVEKELAANPVRSTPAKQKAVVTPKAENPAFEAAWATYPARPGNAKNMALVAWGARVREGVSEQALTDGVKNYAAHCQREKVAPNFVMAAGRFFGKEAHYAANWSVEAPEQLPFFDGGDYSNTVEKM